MGYIVFTLLTITATTVVIYLLTNKVFHIRLKLNSLVLCAVCALFISLVLPHIVISFAGLAGTVIFLAVFAIIFAYFVAYFDAPDNIEPLAAKEEKGGGNELIEQPPEIPIPLVEVVFEPTSLGNSPPETVNDMPSEDESPLPVNCQANCVAACFEPVSCDELSPINVMSELDPANVPDQEPAAEFLLETLELAIDISLIAPTDPTTEAAATVTAKIVAEQHISDSLCESSTPTVASMPDSEEGETVTATHFLYPEPVSDSLDDLLDFAFSQKESANYSLALDAFKKAWKIYHSSDAAPFLAIEIAGLLKNKGAYDEAILVLSEGRNFPIIQKDHVLDQEFIKSIAYLRIVKNILLNNQLGFLPFNRIPVNVSREIDAEFREWRNLA